MEKAFESIKKDILGRGFKLVMENSSKDFHAFYYNYRGYIGVSWEVNCLKEVFQFMHATKDLTTIVSPEYKLSCFECKDTISILMNKFLDKALSVNVLKTRP